MCLDPPSVVHRVHEKQCTAVEEVVMKSNKEKQFVAFYVFNWYIHGSRFFSDIRETIGHRLPIGSFLRVERRRRDIIEQTKRRRSPLDVLFFYFSLACFLAIFGCFVFVIASWRKQSTHTVSHAALTVSQNHPRVPFSHSQSVSVNRVGDWVI